MSGSGVGVGVSGVHEPDECLSIIIMGDWRCWLEFVAAGSAGTVEPGLGGN